MHEIHYLSASRDSLKVSSEHMLIRHLTRYIKSPTAATQLNATRNIVAILTCSLSVDE